MQKKKSDEDAKLIRAYQQGDFLALNQLIAMYWKSIFKKLRHKGIPSHVAEDCTQDICIKLIEGLKRFRFECHFKAYLDSMINNKTVDYYRQKAREKLIISLDKPTTNEGDASTLLDEIKNLNHTDDPAGQMDYEDLQRVIGLCLKKLGNQKMRILLCLWLKGLKIRGMAELLNIGTSDANVTLLRGKEKLRNCVAKYYRKK